MKILNLNNYILEKKSISPLTIKKFKELNLSLPDTYEKLNLKKVKDENIKLENLKDGMIIKYRDGENAVIVKKENFKNAYDKRTDIILDVDPEFFFISMEYDNLIYGIDSDYNNGKNCLKYKAYGYTDLDIITLYESSII